MPLGEHTDRQDRRKKPAAMPDATPGGSVTSTGCQIVERSRVPCPAPARRLAAGAVRRTTWRGRGRYTRVVAKPPPPPPRYGDLDFEPGIPPEPETSDDPFGEDVPIAEPTPQSYGSMLGRAIDRATEHIGDSLSNVQLADLAEASGASYSLEAVDTDGGSSTDTPREEGLDARFGPPIDAETPQVAEPQLALDLPAKAQQPAETAIAVAETQQPAVAPPQALDLLPSPSPSPAGPARRGLLLADPIANALAFVAIGFVLALFPAQQLAKGVVRDQAEPHLVDLEESIERPLAVRAGELEKPQAIASRVEEGTSEARSRFFMIWVAGGLAIGVGGGLIRRSA